MPPSHLLQFVAIENINLADLLQKRKSLQLVNAWTNMVRDHNLDYSLPLRKDILVAILEGDARTTNKYILNISEKIIQYRKCISYIFLRSTFKTNKKQNKKSKQRPEIQ